MSKDYLCKNCKENNNGWCNKLKKQGLKQITSCEYHNDDLKLEVPKFNNDMTNIIEACQQPIKSVPIEERINSITSTKGLRANQLVMDDLQGHFRLIQARSLVESHYEWRKWAQEIPYIKFPGNWEVKAIPPFGGAIIRYIIKHENTSGENSISIYLDCYGELGAVDEPYWELYPDLDGEPYRCGINETDDLLSRLHEILDRYN